MKIMRLGGQLSAVFSIPVADLAFPLQKGEPREDAGGLSKISKMGTVLNINGL